MKKKWNRMLAMLTGCSLAAGMWSSVQVFGAAKLPKLEAELGEWKEQDEDILSYALFPQVAMDFFLFDGGKCTGAGWSERVYLPGRWCRSV